MRMSLVALSHCHYSALLCWMLNKAFVILGCAHRALLASARSFSFSFAAASRSRLLLDSTKQAHQVCHLLHDRAHCSALPLCSEALLAQSASLHASQSCKLWVAPVAQSSAVKPLWCWSIWAPSAVNFMSLGSKWVEHMLLMLFKQSLLS